MLSAVEALEKRESRKPMALARADMATGQFGTVTEGTPAPAFPLSCPRHSSTGESSEGSQGPGPTTALGCRKRTKGNGTLCSGNHFSSLQKFYVTSTSQKFN